MNYRWIAGIICAIALGAAAWYFGQSASRQSPAVKVQVESASTVPAAVQPTKEPPPRVVEFIDLASAYEPVREPELPRGIDPASLIAESVAPRRIPYAVRFDNPYENIIRLVEATSSGRYPLGLAVQLPEPISIPPRDVTYLQSGIINILPLPNGHLLFVPENPFISTPLGAGLDLPREIAYIPMGVPFQAGIDQVIPENASFSVLERLTVMPREVK